MDFGINFHFGEFRDRMFRTIPKVSLYKVKQVLRQAWENEVKLIDVRSPEFREHPWSHIMAHPTEDSYDDDDYVLNAREYLYAQIAEYYEMSLESWMALPRIRKRQLLDLKSEYLAHKAEEGAKAAAEAKRLLDGKGS